MATVSIPSKAYMSSCLRSLPVTSCWCGCRVDGRTGADHEGEVVVEVEVEVVVDQSASTVHTRSLLTRSQHVSPVCIVVCSGKWVLYSVHCSLSPGPRAVFFVSSCELSCASARARAPLLLGDMAGAGKTPEEEAYERKQEYKAYLHKHGMNTYGFCLEWWWWCL